MGISFPLRHVLSVVEAEKGVSTGVIFRDQFCVVIEAFHVVVYSGAAGISIPCEQQTLEGRRKRITSKRAEGIEKESVAVMCTLQRGVEL